ncbi:transmembrane emp24 domain-containing protein 1 isoform X1 [Bacillus rossius redtenbacheri]|uniref:transmembrane emp24 domain-containing protein 1 isoform X1 n=1 Tax=Bacillus rossius redtenbacheri TaxID=93214 RepID=UPI002FDD507E
MTTIPNNIPGYVIVVHAVYCLEKDMTISIQPKKEECFFENVSAGQVMELEYQVIDGGQGDLDINFRFISPSGNVITSDIKRMENVIRVGATEEGHYQMCWDNSFSHFNSKTVFFEILIDEDDDEDVWDHFDGLSPEEYYDMKVQDIQTVLDQVRTNLNKIQHLQDLLKATEARDRSIAEGNFVRVNYWSMVQIAVMIMVGLIQVVMVRNLFDDNSKVSRLLKGKLSS